MIVGAYLIEHGWKPNEALERVHELTRAVQKKPFPETGAQRTAVLEWTTGGGVVTATPAADISERKIPKAQALLAGVDEGEGALVSGRTSSVHPKRTAEPLVESARDDPTSEPEPLEKSLAEVKLIATKHLRSADIPRISPKALYSRPTTPQLNALWAFALTFDGYAYFGNPDPAPGRLGRFAQDVAREFRETRTLPKLGEIGMRARACSTKRAAGASGARLRTSRRPTTYGI